MTLSSQGFAQITYRPFAFTTLAGESGYGSADGTKTSARFWNPSGLALDGAGNILVADKRNNTIRQLTPAGVVTTLAGLAGVGFGERDGTGSAARFWSPSSVAMDLAGNIYVTDGDTIRKVTSTGVVATVAGSANVAGYSDGPGSDARFSGPSGVAVDGSGILYVADSGNHVIRTVTPTGFVTTLAGNPFLTDSLGQQVGGSSDGVGSVAAFNHPGGVALDEAGNLYVADTGNHTLRKVTPTGTVSTLAGLAKSSGSADGIGSSARFNEPLGVAVDRPGNIYVADARNQTIRKVKPDGDVITLAGLVGIIGSDDGAGKAARFNRPAGVAADNGGSIYVADGYNNTIRKVTPDGGVTTLAGVAQSDKDGQPKGGNSDGPRNTARFDEPVGVALDGEGNLYVTESRNYAIRKVTPAGEVTTFAGKAEVPGSADGAGSAAEFGIQFNGPRDLAIDGAGNLYVADTWNHTIRKVTPAGKVTTLAGTAGKFGSSDGKGSAARFNEPFGVTVDKSGYIYVADTINCTIRKITPAGEVTTLAGSGKVGGSADGIGSNARFVWPSAVAVDNDGNVYVADTGNNRIRKVSPMGLVTTVAADTGPVPAFANPSGIAVDATGNIFVADTSHNAIWRIAATGELTTLAGMVGSDGSADGTGAAVRFKNPAGIALDIQGNLYVADMGNNIIRKGVPDTTTRSVVPSEPIYNSNDGSFEFTLTGPTGQWGIVEVSTDLINWRLIWSRVLGGSLNFDDSQAVTYSRRFYRARMP